MTEPRAELSRFEGFIQSLALTLDRAGSDEAGLLSHAGEALAELVSYDDWLPDEFARPHPDYYQQYLLYRDPAIRFSIVSFVWGPGQFTPIHDHQTWGLVGMLRGAEISQAFSLCDERPVAGEESRLEPGQVLALSPSAGDIHRVRNAFDDRTSISIHVYGGDIGAISRWVFLPEGGRKAFISGYANAPSDGGGAV